MLSFRFNTRFPGLGPSVATPARFRVGTASAFAFVLLLLLLAAATPGMADGASISSSKEAVGPAIPTSQPNVVLIQTDDQTRADVFAEMRNAFGKRAPVMPATVNKIGKRGISFDNYYVSYPLCCPSRATLLTGQYAHSNGVIGNVAPDGGWTGFRNSSSYSQNLAPWLQSAGYRTIHIGKFLNQYGTDELPESVVPPGWDVWQSDATDNSTRFFYGYMSNMNGEIQGPFGNPIYGRFAAVDPPGCLYAPVSDTNCNHKSDMITRRAVAQIEAAAADPVGTRRPFYMQLDYNAPHGDHQPPIGPEPTPRNYGRAEGTPVPKTPAFNEADVSDKPSFIRDHAHRLNSVELRRMRIEYRKTLESLRDVDDGVRRVLSALNKHGMMENTYIIFISDNGFFRGEHRMERSKFLPYEPAVHMPLLIRGPGIARGSSTGELTANIDLAPTILELARARPTKPLDGRSMVPFLRDPERRTRRPILLESFAKATDIVDAPGSGEPNPPSGAYQEPPPSASSSSAPSSTPRSGGGTANASISAPVENYGGVRLGRYKYVEYETGDIELYDLLRDPHELQNRAGFKNYRYVQGFLTHQLIRLVNCRGKGCKYTTGIIPVPGEPKAKLRWGPRERPAKRR